MVTRIVGSERWNRPEVQGSSSYVGGSNGRREPEESGIKTTATTGHQEEQRERGIHHTRSDVLAMASREETVASNLRVIVRSLLWDPR